MIEILFVCTGNTCRSPMAEGLFNLYAEKHGIDARAFSRGIAADGGAVSENAAAALKEFGADISAHVSRQLEHSDLERADRAYCMSAAHCEAVKRAFPDCADKVEPISARGVSDPFGGNLERYRAAALEIAREVKRIADGLKEGGNGD